jgi:hypothetical protein
VRWLSLLVIAGGWLALGHLGNPCALAQEFGPQPTLAQPGVQPAAPAGETTPLAGANRGPTAAPAPIAPSPLDTYLLRDSKGNLVPVLDLPFEEFERLLRIKRGLAPPALPGYSLDVLSVTGTAADDHSGDRPATGNVANSLVDLQVAATIRVRDSDWVRVPLALGKAVLRQPAKYEGPGEHFLAYEPTEDAYVAWLRGANDKPHVLSLQVSLPVARLGDRRQMALRLPRATESTLRLTVPEPRIEATMPAGEGILSQRSTSGGQSEITVLGPAGDVQLVWQSRPEMVPASQAALEATAEIAIKVEGEDRIRSEARLRVRNPSGSLEAFRVALPLGMEWEPTTIDGLTMSLVTPEPGLPGVPAPPQPQVVDVQLNRPATGTVELRLSAVATPVAGAVRAGQGRGGQGGRTSVAAIAPARFVVEGAVRQRGTIDVAVEGDWQLSWRGEQSVRRLDLPQDPTLAKVAARYEYSRQPCNLQLTVAPRPSRISVEPLHVITVEGRFARLESTLKYRLRGARAAGLTVDLAGWQLDQITPVDLLDLTSVTADPEKPGPRTIPFLPGAVIGAELELQLEAHQPLDPDAGELSLSVPRLVADVVSPATVVVVPADNVELTPLVDKIERLSLDPTLQPARVASSQQTPIAYREIGSDQPATFAADYRVRTQWTTVGARGKITLEPQQMLVQQLLDYRIAYERRRTFDLLVPRDVAASGTLKVILGGQTLTPLPVADAPVVGDATRFRVVTPSDQLGQCQLQVEYTVPLVEWDAAEPLPLTIPLVVPAEEPHQQVGGQQIEFALEAPWQIDPDTSGSDEFSRPTQSPTGPGRSIYVWSRAAPATRWFLRASAAPIREKSLLAKVWIQTYLDGGLRQERAVFRVATDETQLIFRLPRAPVTGSVRGAVNAQEAALVVREPTQVVVTLPSAGATRERTVELWYACEADAPRGVLAALGLASPGLKPISLEGATPPRRVFWQLVVPGDAHLVALPRQYAGELAAADWLPLLGQSASGEQDRLEAWIGASRQDPLPRGTRQYVFGSVGKLTALDCWLAGRRLLLFTASGLTLVVGLALLHVPLVRRPEALLVLAVGLAALAWGFPQAAMLLAQGATVGLAVVALFAVWTWSRARAASPVSSARLAPMSTPASAAANSGHGSKAEARLVDSQARGAVGLGSVSTATAPAGNPAAESHS